MRSLSILAAGLFLFSLTASLMGEEGKITVGKKQGKPKTDILQKEAILNHLFPKKAIKQRHRNNNKVLVLLVDFQEDANPFTTGTGKFLLERDSSYAVSIGAPPHDREYFSAIMEAVKYYYRAASYESYQMEYSVFPHTGAYTLPQEMGYYNPGVNSEFFVQRTEEYFHDAVTVADADAAVTFADYGHIIIIHAGSDWQHDVLSDSQQDLPTIQVDLAEEAQISVDNGTYTVTHAMSIPETISQDGSYGITTANIVHEFGHSLGTVDLYNTANFRPGVGYYDIMDSGGSGILTTTSLLDGTTLYDVEGAFPGLPGAYTRLILWGEDYYAGKGWLKNINDFSPGETIEITASSAKVGQFGANNLYMLKIPLNDKEYLLVENREVDPDGDGGTSMVGALPITPGGNDFRVITRPAPFANYDLSYEYDFLLPGWTQLDANNNLEAYLGGGLVVWHIDNRVLYDEGVTQADGTFLNNFEANTVNTDWYDRGVQIVEADNMPDIGNANSWFWEGTAYEPFFRNMPNFRQIEQDGSSFLSFEGWKGDTDKDGIHTREFSGYTAPAMQAKDGLKALWALNDISNLGPKMTFTIALTAYDDYRRLKNEGEATYVSFAGNSQLDNVATNVAMIRDGKLSFAQKIINGGNWTSSFERDFDYLPDFPILTQADHFYLAGNKKLVTFDEFEENVTEYATDFSDMPYVGNELTVVPTLTELTVSKNGNERVIPLGGAVFAVGAASVFAMNENEARLEYDTGEELIFSSFKKGERALPIGIFEQNTFYAFDKNNDLYMFGNKGMQKIFSAKSYGSETPTQIGITAWDGEPALVFGLGKRIFVLTPYGTLYDNYPVSIEKTVFTPFAWSLLLEADNHCIAYLPSSGSYFAYDLTARRTFAGVADGSITSGNAYETENGKVGLLFNKSDGTVFTVALSSEAVLRWSGFKNGGDSAYHTDWQPQNPPAEKFTAFVYPNPLKKTSGRIRLVGAGEKAEIKIYNIAGELVKKLTVTDIHEDTHDVALENKFASGVYYMVVKSDRKTVTTPLVIEN